MTPTWHATIHTSTRRYPVAVQVRARTREDAYCLALDAADLGLRERVTQIDLYALGARGFQLPFHPRAGGTFGGRP